MSPLPEPRQLRGRPRTRSASLARSRQLSRAARTPPVTPDPPSSPSGVCPSWPSGKGSDMPLFLLARSSTGDLARLSISPRSVGQASDGARHALQLLSPASLVSVETLSRPPGFGASPECLSTPLRSVGSAVPASPLLGSGGGTATSSVSSPVEPLAPLFRAKKQALLGSPPPVRLTARRKTLAGVSISRGTSYSVRRSSARLKAKKRARPIVQAAETVVCRSLGIIQDGEEVTEQAMAEFSRRFQGQVPGHVLATMRVLFRVNTPEEEAVDLALMGLGGAAALDQEAGDVAVLNV
uniref:Uncharacterized protein n=1 Tax=Avena sativa TaxID=4498 RepID=A0ACD6A9Q3_AVESA